MLRFEKDLDPGDWSFNRLEPAELGGHAFVVCGSDELDQATVLKIRIPFRPEADPAEWLQSFDGESSSTHYIDFRKGGSGRTPEYGPREWWFDGNYKAPTIKESLKSWRDRRDKNGGQLVIHGFLTNGHWLPCSDDNATVSF